MNRGILYLAIIVSFVLTSCSDGDPVDSDPPANSLTVELIGSGTGRVTSNTTGIDCGDTCSATFEQGSNVTLVATPTNDSAFAEWEGDCSGSDATCTITIDGNVDVQARFSRQYELAVSTTGDGLGTITSSPAGIDCGDACNEPFVEGTEVVLTATPAIDSTFDGWQGACSDAERTCTLTMNEAKNTTAQFALRPPPEPDMARLTVLTTGSGTVTSDPVGIACGETCVEDFPEGTSVTLTATPGAEAVFDAWGGACNGNDKSCTITLDASTTVSATFDALYELTVSTTGSGDGNVTSNPAGIDCGSDCSEPFVRDTGVTLTASPASGSVLTGWSGGGCGSNPTCDVEMNQDLAIEAQFERMREVTVSVSGRGHITSDDDQLDCTNEGGECSAEYVNGEQIVLTASPDAYATFEEWTGACTGTSDSCTLEITQDHSAQANFRSTAILVTSTSGSSSQVECTLRDAINAANTDNPVGGCPAGDGADTILLPPNGTITLQNADNDTEGPNGLPSIYTNLEIDGNGSTITRSDVAEPFRILHLGLNADLTLRDLTISNGADNGFDNETAAGAIYSKGNLTLDGVTVRENKAQGDEGRGITGGIYSEGPALTVLRSTISENSSHCVSYCNGGISVSDSMLEIRESTIERNSSEGLNGPDGSGLSIDAGEAFIFTTRFQGNYSRGDDDGGGAIGIGSNAVVEIRSSEFVGNSAMYGGTIYNLGALTIRDSTISGSLADYGGAIRNIGSLQIIDSSIEASSTTFVGGGLANSGYAILSGTTILGCADDGGVVFNEGELRLTNASLLQSNCDPTSAPRTERGGVVFNGLLSGTSQNDATFDCTDSRITGGRTGRWTLGYGGGVYNNFAEFRGENCTIDGNRSNDDGGGIYSSGHVYLENSVVKNNVADADYDKQGAGGGIFITAAGRLTLLDSTVGGPNAADGNSARTGGGVYLKGARHTIARSFIEGNSADSDGGGVVLDFSDSVHEYDYLSLNDTVVTRNVANIDGGGIFLLRGTARLENSSVVDNQADVNQNDTGVGGGIYLASEGDYTLDNTTVENNTPDDVFTEP